MHAADSPRPWAGGHVVGWEEGFFFIPAPLNHTPLSRNAHLRCVPTIHPHTLCKASPITKRCIFWWLSSRALCLFLRRILCHKSFHHQDLWSVIAYFYHLPFGRFPIPTSVKLKETAELVSLPIFRLRPHEEVTTKFSKITSVPHV